MVASFHCWGTSPVLHILASMKVPDKLRVVEFSTSAGRKSGPTAFQFGISRITPIMSSMVGSTPSDGAKGRCENRAVMVMLSLGDFLFRRVWKNPPFTNAHVVP